MIYDIFISVVCFERPNNLSIALTVVLFTNVHEIFSSLNVLLTTYFIDQLCVFMPLKEWIE